MSVPFAMVAITGIFTLIPISSIIKNKLKNQGENISKETYD